MVPRWVFQPLANNPAVLGAVCAIVVLSCQLPPNQTETPRSEAPSAQLHLLNMDGPTVKVFVAGAEVATVGCGQSATVTPQQLPPWEIIIVDASGAELLRKTLSDAPEQGVIIRSDAVRAGPWPIPGGPAPAMSCPPS